MSIGRVGMTADGRRPRVSYLLCSTPRSGSTMLCELLEATGVAGHPQEFFQQVASTGMPRRPLEYFGDAVTPEIRAAVGADDRSSADHRGYAPAVHGGFGAYLESVLRRGTTPNGVFGAKLMWGYVDGLVTALRELPGVGDRPAPEALALAFGEPRYMWVRRRGTDRQAVSLWRALQTWAWRSEGDDRGDGRDGGDAVYLFDAIDALERSLRADDAAWERFFAEAGVEPATIVYEDFSADPAAGTRALLGRLGVESDVPDGPRTERQADERSEEWVRRYRAERDRALSAASGDR